MYKFICKWLLASLVTPLITLASSGYVFGFAFQLITIFFWPSSLFLMSLGAEERPTLDVVYVWFIAVIVNMFLYAVIGSAIYLFLSKNGTEKI